MAAMHAQRGPTDALADAGSPPAGAGMHDVVIVGGGLAGLTLALQLRARLPDLDVVIVERRRHPVPEAAHKVGESSVEIAAWYFGRELGLEAYLAERQLKKFGFRFFFNEGAPHIDRVAELGASTFLPTPSYQLDRGRLENDLARFAAERGVRFIDGATVSRITLPAGGDEAHRVDYRRDGETASLAARWLVDASGRAGLLKRQLDLAELNAHDAGAVWFRIGGRIDVNDWSDDVAWRSRCDPPNRWLSTNHLVGPGYWVWLIPLASGAHSVGIVADRSHPVEAMDTFEKAMAWLAVHQPQLHAVLAARRDTLRDFAFFRRFSYGARRMFDGRARWALTGEAGVFLDPFYSPGSDFIAIANTQITEMIALDRARGPVQMVAAMYEQVFFSLYRNMLPIYVGQYPIFGDACVLPVKVIWDYAFYWGIMCPLVIQRRILDLSAMARWRTALERIERLNVAVQALLRDWCAARTARIAAGLPVRSGPDPARMLDQASLPWFVELNAALLPRLDAAGIDARLARSCAQLDALAAEIAALAAGECPEVERHHVMAAIGESAANGEAPAGDEARGVSPGPGMDPAFGKGLLFPAFRPPPSHAPHGSGG